METINNKLPENMIHFFRELSEYLDTKLYFYGSVQRSDYFHGKSDIDIDIFTDNREAMMQKIQHFLHVKKADFKKIVWRMDHNNRVVHGNKIMYKNEEENIIAEFSIYDDKWKNDIIKIHKDKIILPFYISWVLVVLKFIYYTLNAIDRPLYKYLKGDLLNYFLGKKNEEFLIFEK